MEKSCLSIAFWLTRRLRVCGEKKEHFLASCIMSNKLLLVARHILTMGFENACKVGSVNFMNSLAVTAFHCEERTHQK